MNTIAHPAFVGAAKLVAKTSKYVRRAFESVMEARARRVQQDIEFRRSFDAYREGKGIPPLNEDLRA